MKRTIIIIFCILGMIIGVSIGQGFAGSSALNFLALGGSIGVKNPVIIDLGFLQFTIGIWLTINVCGIICMVVLGLISKVILDWLKI